ncbi:DUF1569 domain-containing protein [Leptospira gomenensis]|uniref:DUF1569 domain-containing protein n=1 Tax=Leptospira gomenensis TaxID=2484974 RepID=A0A5F1YKV7_9LEPT|nr:DUF1569 domain-containing protein [Leptospira gomenensis]TGK33435.1 DUF1569 domain-containing protein [Leptospira gomenensis]TGK45149.1 DUF1569 domain-containing protein [Leptospira gomenensis]TGK51103.1 DUF1569 domain-containing protein [Leptospira gomenensis]TGK56631.1 DUF1569 domain-containing protein [Leptospira gomenensis]
MLRVSAGAVLSLGAAGFATANTTGCSSGPKGATDRNLKYTSLDTVLEELNTLEKSNAIEGYGTWDAGKIFLHCAQSIEYSVQGYPENKSVVFQNTAGKLAFLKFSFSQKMSHDLEAPIPGATEIRSDTDWKKSLSILRETILKFRAYGGELKPHFAYGNLTKSEYDLAHAMHIADHFSYIKVS